MPRGLGEAKKRGAFYDYRTSRESYKESFIENLQKILKGVDASLDKVCIFDG